MFFVKFRASRTEGFFIIVGFAVPIVKTVETLGQGQLGSLDNPGYRDPQYPPSFVIL